MVSDIGRCDAAPGVILGPGDEPDAVQVLVLDLLEWVGPSGRPYDEVMEAWRTSCPRLPVWEEATARGLVVRHDERGRGRVVSVSPAGRDHLERQRHVAPA